MTDITLHECHAEMSAGRKEARRIDDQQSVTILGAGLLGRLLAWRLAKQGQQVTVLEQSSRERPESAAFTAAAMVAPISERPLCHADVFQHGLNSLALWPELLAELEVDCQRPTDFRQEGSLIVAHPADEAEMKQFEADLRFHQLLQSDSVERLNQQQLRQLEPDLAPHFEQAYWLKNEAQVDNRSLLPNLLIAAQHYGVDFQFGVAVEKTKKGWSLTRTSDKDTGESLPETEIERRLQHQRVIDCRGVGATQLPIRGVRGEVLWVEAPQFQLARPVRLLHPRYHLYLVPRANNQLQLGATEIESADRTPVSVRSAMEMLSALWCLSPALAEARILSMETNLRPASPDHRPMIEENDMGLSVNGLFRHGYLMAPSILQQLDQEYGLLLGMRNDRIVTTKEAEL